MSEIRIRRYRPGDVDTLYEAVRESIGEISPWMAWCSEDYSREVARAWVETRDQEWNNDASYDFVVEAEDGRFLGAVGLNAIDLIALRANFGYWIRTSASGCGVAVRAGRELIQYAFANTPLCRLEIVVALENHRSHRVAQKLGGVREGVLRERLRPAGVPQDAVMYSVLRSDWEAAPSE